MVSVFAGRCYCPEWKKNKTQCGSPSGIHRISEQQPEHDAPVVADELFNHIDTLSKAQKPL